MATSRPFILGLVLAIAMAGGSAAAETLTGTASVHDGDTLTIGEQRVRLASMDAPELAQRCGGRGALARCGVIARDRLKAVIGGSSVTCVVQEHDAYGRAIADCTAGAVDLSEWMVTNGYAMAFVRYSAALAASEKVARARGAGFWQVEFEPPWAFRAERWKLAAGKAPDGYAIKGNISASGERIYHTPWGDRRYARTRIDPAKGERWFCDEAAAKAAGWRPPLG